MDVGEVVGARVREVAVVAVEEKDTASGRVVIILNVGEVFGLSSGVEDCLALRTSS